MVARFCYTTSVILLTGVSLISATGCGPGFFSAKGSFASDGGPLDKWNALPAVCSRDEFDGDSSKLITFHFAAPDNKDPDRALHRNEQPNSPASLRIAKNGGGIIAKLDMMKPVKGPAGDMMAEMRSMDGYTLDNSTCKTLTLDRTEQMGSFGTLHKQLKGRLTLDCSVAGSHLTSDLNFTHCGM
jgi:hypothetical protein